LRYEHQLEGVNDKWVTTDARTVALAGFASGSYRFLVRAALANGITGEAARVEFTVLAPFWQRWWFMAFAGASVLLLGLAFHRASVKHHVELERVRARIAADLHDGVGAHLSRIAIVSEVVRQQAESVLPDAVPALASIADNARDLIDDMSDAVWSIDPRLDNLQQVVIRTRALASELFDAAAIGWTLDASDRASHVALAAEQRRHLYLILKETMTNVVRHAQAAHVVVRIAIANGRLRLEITDDGIGIESVASATRGSGRGISNLHTRAKALRGTLSVTPGPGGRGTTVALDAPLGPIA
jgi:signal transduction histidine kinase